MRSDYYPKLYIDPLDRQSISRSASADGASEPLNANDPLMDHSTQISNPDCKLGMDRKRKAEDDDHQEGRRVRSGVPLSTGLSEVSDGEGSSWGPEGEEYASAEAQQQQYAESGYTWLPPRSTTGHWASFKQESDSFAQEGARQTGAIHVSDPSSAPEMHGTPPRYSGNPASPEAGGTKRKRHDGDGLEEEASESSKRRISKATDASSPIREGDLAPAVTVFSYHGMYLGQLLPCGEIIGFVELPPLAQLYDLYRLSLIKPKAEHTWIHRTWQLIHKSAGSRTPLWQQNYWPEEIEKSGAANIIRTFRAIKTFREMSEKLWQVPSSASFQQTLNLLVKEMDYTVLLLLVHGHQDHRGVLSDRLKVLFERLDPALRPGNWLANLTSSAVASEEPTAEDSTTQTQARHLPSDLPAAMEESPEREVSPKTALPCASASASFQQGTHDAVKDERMDTMW